MNDATPRDWPAGAGDMARRIRAFDWATTPLGPMGGWPQSLKTAVDILLAAGHAMQLAWGPHGTVLYNDAYAPMLGERHPSALGIPFAEAWPEIWNEIEPLVDRVFAGETVRFENMPLVMTRHGYREDTCWSFSYSPVRDEAGAVAGLLNVTVDATPRHRAEHAEEVLSEEFRNTKILKDLSARLVTEENIQTIYEEILTAAIEITRAKAGTVQMLDSGTGELVAIATRGFSPQTEEYFHRVDASSNTSCGLALRTGDRAYFNFEPASMDVSIRLHVGDGVLSAQSSPLVSRSGKPIGMVSTHWAELDHRPSERELRFLDLLVRQAADLIEQRRAEAALRESEERLALAVDIGGVGHWELNLATRELLTSALCRRNFGRSEQDSFTYDELVSSIHPEDRERQQQAVAAAIENKSGFDIEYRLVTPRGEMWWANVRGRFEDGDNPRLVGVSLDITERKRAEEASREGEQRLAAELSGTQLLQRLSTRLIPEQQPEALYAELLDAAMALMKADGASVQILDAEGQRLGLLASRNFHPDSNAFWQWVDADPRTSCGKALITNVRVEIENIDDLSEIADSKDIVEYRRSGFRATQSTPLISRDGKRLGMISTLWREPHRAARRDLALFDVLARQAADLIERNQAQNALREREADLARVQRIGQVGGVNVDVAGGLRSWRSPEYLRLHGLPDQVHEESHAQWVARVHADDRKAAERGLFSALEGRSLVYESEYRIVRPSDGEIRWIHARADIERDANGKAVRLVGAHVDVTEQKLIQDALRESEERLRQFGEASLDVLWMRDAATLQWTYLTPAFETIYGLDREAALRGDNYTNWIDLVVPEDRERVLGEIKRVGEGRRATFEYRIRRPVDGQTRWLRNTDFPMYDAQGKVRLIGGIGHDVTAMKRAEEHQKLLLAELQHRVRNTLSVIRAIARMTVETSSSIGELGMHLDGRIAAFARVQAAVTRDPSKGIDLEVLVAETLRASAAREGEQFEVKGPAIKLVPKAAETLGLAFHELATNAVKYGALVTPNGYVAVRWRQHGDGDMLALEWTETGAKIKEVEPKRQGFGTELLMRTLAYDLEARVRRAFSPEGVNYSISLPIARIAKS